MKVDAKKSEIIRGKTQLMQKKSEILKGESQSI